MLLTVPAGGGSRLGGVIQRGLRIFRQVLHGKRPPGSGVGPEQNLARLAQNQLSRVVPRATCGNVCAVVRQGARGVLANYLSQNQIHNLAAEMRRRYAFCLMSGSARFYTGLSNRIAIYSFVGISFGGFVHNHAYPGEKNGCDPVEHVVQGLFKEKSQVEASSILETRLEADEETKLLVVRLESLSDESDISILNEEEASEDGFKVVQENEMCLSTAPLSTVVRLESLSDESDISILNEEEASEDGFKVIQANEMCLSTAPLSTDFLSSDAEMIREMIDVTTRQNADLHDLVQKLRQENADLKQITHFQALEEEVLKRELCSTLKIVHAQQKELSMLRGAIRNHEKILETALIQLQASQMRPISAKGLGLNPGYNGTSRDNEQAVHRTELTAGTVINSETDMERLRAKGGRVRGLKVHRKKRMKNV